MSISLALISRPIIFYIPTNCMARWFLGIIFILLVNCRFLVVLLLWAYLCLYHLVCLSCFRLLVNLDRLNTLFVIQVRVDSLELPRRGVLLKLNFGTRGKHLQSTLLLVDLPLPRSSLVGDWFGRGLPVRYGVALRKLFFVTVQARRSIASPYVIWYVPGDYWVSVLSLFYEFFLRLR